jgi:hypothetical protein
VTPTTQEERRAKKGLAKRIWKKVLSKVEGEPPLKSWTENKVLEVYTLIEEALDSLDDNALEQLTRKKIETVVEERLKVWIETQPLLPIAQTLKTKQLHVFYINGIWYFSSIYPSHRKTGYWPITLRGKDQDRCPRTQTHAFSAPLTAFVEAYRQATADVVGAMPVPAQAQSAD